MLRRRRFHGVLALAAALSFFACGGPGTDARGADGEGAGNETAGPGPGAAPSSSAPAPQQSGSANTTAPATGSPVEAAGTPPFEGTTGLTTRRAGGSGIATQTAVRSGRQDGYDRVVFEFAGSHLPGYHIEYIDAPARHCGSGAPARITGGALLSVRMTPARAHDDAGEVTVADRAAAPGLPVIRQLTMTCDVEAEVTWTIGVAATNGYRVLELREPTRLVVDVLHRQDVHAQSAGRLVEEKRRREER